MSKIIDIDTNSWHLFIDESGDSSYKRLRRLKQKNNWSEFRPDPEPQNVTIFSLVGVLIDGNELVNSLIPAIKKFKDDLYGDENTILHMSDMLAGTKNFTMYKNDPALFKEHIETIIDAIREIDFVFNLVYIDKVRMLNVFGDIAANPYELAPVILMEKSAGYICNVKKSENKIVRVWFESRNKKKDTELKKFMVSELGVTFPGTEKIIKQNNFPRYKSSHENIKKIEWHIHSLPKDPLQINKVRYYASKYSDNVARDLIHGIHLADMIVYAARRAIESEAYNKYKYLKVEPIIRFMRASSQLKYEKYFP